MINNGLKSSKDGTLMATLGKKLDRVVRITAAECREIYSLGGPYKEITFVRVPKTISFFVDIKDEDHKLSIDDRISIEAQMAAAFIQADKDVEDDASFEIWLWK